MILTRVRSATDRNHWDPSSIYCRGFVSTDTAPTPVGHVITGYEPPMTIDGAHTRFSPEARPFIIQIALRSSFVNTHESVLVSRLSGELRGAFDPIPVDEVVDSPTTCPSDPLILLRRSLLP